MTQPIPVMHLVSTLGIGGQEMVILQLVERIDRTRFAPVVVAVRGGGPLQARIEAAGIPVQVVGDEDTGHLTLVSRISRLLRRLDIGILHTHNPAPHQLGALAAMVARTPVVIHTKHGRNNIARWRRRLAERVAGRLTDMVVPVSEDAAHVAMTVDRVPRRKVRVIRNGVALPVASPLPPLPNGAPVRAVHVARLHAIKDQVTLLHAIRGVVDARPTFHVDIIGDGPAGDEVRALAVELGLEEAVRFHGMRDDVDAFLTGADLFLLSSVSEGISLTLLEAMSHALPVVATDVGGNREVVVDNATGLLVPARDPGAMAEAILALVDDPERRRRYGAQGRRRVEEEFSLDRTVDAYHAAYAELLTAAGRWSVAASEHR
jgi:glycosyltransferase involved in cell wall biosynthesis